MALHVTASKLEDLELIQPRDEEAKLIECIGIEHFYNLLQLGQCLTIWQDETIIGIGGVYRLWSGVYEIWVLPSQYITKYATGYLRIIKQYIKSIVITHNIRRLQSTSINNMLHDRWMGFLGFTKEGILTGYSPDGVDYAMWSLINGKLIEGYNRF